MLVLSRQRDETIMIGDDVMITIVDIRGDKVRLGITAPTKIAVHRKEVYDAIKAENERAALLASADTDALRAAFRNVPTRGPRAAAIGGASGASSPLPKPKLSGSPIGPLASTPSPVRSSVPLRMEGAG
jgi:carbon storage regulator